MEHNYATQMDAARRGIVTPELKKVAEKEKQMNRRNAMHVADRKEAEKPAFCECGFAVQRAFQEGVSCEI